MRNKKISKLVDPSFRLYFLVGFLFAAVTVRVSIPLAICEAAAMAFLWWYFRHTAQKRREGIRQYIDDVTDDMTTADKASMFSAPFAMMVFRPDTQEILWSNDSFMQLTGVREDIFDNRIDDILPDFPTHWLLEGKSECPETVVMGGRHFRVFGNLSHPSSRRGGQSLLATTYWTDVTEQDSLREENESRRPIVSVIVIDNYEELMKAGSEASRSAVLAAIDEKISTWLKNSHSLLRKFDRNRYVLVTTEQEYQKLLEGKFSVLDAVRSVVTEDGVAATLSIGVGKDVDDYETLYQNAMLSIEMALSRGGDQVVVRNRLDFEFYGGKAKSPEKRTKVKSRVMANALGELISDAGQIFVMGHAHADMDVVGAAAGICCIARKRGKKAQIVIDMGTATTMSVLDQKGCFIGGVILPGLRTSLDALVSNAAQLSQTSLAAPKKVIGKNTLDCLRGGMIYGNAASIDGMIERMEEELGCKCTIVATGGLAQAVIPHCRHNIIIDEDLLLKGLQIIYEKNR